MDPMELLSATPNFVGYFIILSGRGLYGKKHVLVLIWCLVFAFTITVNLQSNKRTLW